MLSFLFRLDDACPQMNHENWSRIELILDSYNVKPIVGIIPNSRDVEFNWQESENFWNDARAWQKKGWTIAQHGLHHVFLNKIPKKDKYFQLSHSVNTEFAGITFDEQYNMLKNGYSLLKEKGITPTCFFAPAHTFDNNTVSACTKLQCFKFISDGYALRPYLKQDMVFIPSVFDGPYKLLPFGVYTFVLHPSKMSDANFMRLELFLQKNKKYISTTKEVLDSFTYIKRQGLVGVLLERGIFIARSLRKWVNNFARKK